MIANRQIMNEWLARADKEGFAIPHFNYNDIWDMRAIVEAAEELRAPVIIACIPRVTNAHGTARLGSLAYATAEQAKVPVFIHLDHSPTIEDCIDCVDNKFTAVMIDGSKLPLADNIASVKTVSDYAHPRNVLVEAEVGKILGSSDEAAFGGGDFLVEVADVVELTQKAPVDMVAIGIGTAHGFYEGTPEINFKRLEEVNDVVDTPLVLHGGTGIPLEDVRHAIKLGINKVNVGTIIRYTYMSTLRKELNERGDSCHPLDLYKPVVEAMKAPIRDWIKVCMADGKA